jgi:ribosomal protein S1
VMKIDEQKRRLSLSIREAATWQRLTGSEKGTPAGRVEVGQILKGVVEDHKPYGLFVRLPQLGMRGRGLLPIEELLDADRVDLKKKWPPGKEIEVEILAIDEKGRVRLSEKSIREKEDREGYAQFLQKEKSDEKRNTLGDLFKKLKL